MKVLGIMILSVPFIGFTVHMIRESGLLVAFKVWMAIFAFFGWVAIGVWLVNK